jgi:hypothetical protein
VPETLALVPHETDHIIATKHGGETSSADLALCCTLCNKYKGTDLASIAGESGECSVCSIPAGTNGRSTSNCEAV